MRREAFFLESGGGKRFCLLSLPEASQPLRGAIVYFHPFAEEINRSRHFVATQARNFADAGFAVLQIDLHGCGDSSGDFGEATWAGWLADGLAACAFMQQRYPAPLWLWGLRAGALLATDVARSLSQTFNQSLGLLLWHPWLSGQQGLQQFLRIGMAAELLEGAEKGQDNFRRRLEGGDPVEIAGYVISPDFARELQGVDLLLPESHCKFAWLEFSSRADATLSFAAKSVITRWQNASHKGDARVVMCPPVWQRLDTPVCPELSALSLSALTGAAFL